MDSNALAPLKIVIYGVDDEIKRTVTRSIVPWGILERALDIQEQFDSLGVSDAQPQLNREQIQTLTDFVVYVFDDQITADELKRGASIQDMLALYNQIFKMVSQVMPKNPTTALTPAQNLQKVRQGKP